MSIVLGVLSTIHNAESRERMSPAKPRDLEFQGHLSRPRIWDQLEWNELPDP